MHIMQFSILIFFKFNFLFKFREWCPDMVKSRFGEMLHPDLANKTFKIIHPSPPPVMISECTPSYTGIQQWLDIH